MWHLVSISLLARSQSHNSLSESQVLENALTHRIVSDVLQLQAGPTEMHFPVSVTVDTRSLSVFTLLVSYWLPLFPGWQLDHDLRSQTELKGGLGFL